MDSNTEYTICQHCHHFVDPNDDYEPGNGNAEFVHLENGEQEFDHDAQPSEETKTLKEWEQERPELFKEYEDGEIGPNSIHFDRKGKCDE